MNQKSDISTTASEFKKRFPTPKDFVDWMLANNKSDEGRMTYEERVKHFQELRNRSTNKD
jgi:hypothetical protein